MAEIKQMKTLRFPNSDITYELVDAEARAQIATIEEEIATLDNGGFGVVVPYEGVFLSDMMDVSIPISIQAISIPRAKYDLLQAKPNMSLILEVAEPSEFALEEPTLTFKQLRKSVLMNLVSDAANTEDPDNTENNDTADLYQEELMLFVYSGSIYTPSDLVTANRDPLTAYVAFNKPVGDEEEITGIMFGGILCDFIDGTRFDYPMTVDMSTMNCQIHTSSATAALSAISGMGWFYLLLLMGLQDDTTTEQIREAVVSLMLSEYNADAGFKGMPPKTSDPDNPDEESMMMSLLLPRCRLPGDSAVSALAAMESSDIHLGYKWFDTASFPISEDASTPMTAYLILDIDENDNFLGTAHIEMEFNQGITYDYNPSDLLESSPEEMAMLRNLPILTVYDNKLYLKRAHMVGSNTEYDYISMNLDCPVVTELPEASREEADLNKLYSLNGELYKAYFYQTSQYAYPLASSGSQSLPRSMTGRACAMIGSDIYIFGGNIRDKASEDDTTITWLNGGYKLDYANNVRTDLNLDFGEVALDSCAAAVVGTNIYIGTDTHFWKFDTTTNTLTAMDWALESGMAVGSNMLTAIDNSLYFVSTDSTIVSINVDTNEILVHTDVLPSSDYYGASVVNHNNMIYVVGGRSSNKAYVFNPSTSETDTIDLSFIGSAYYDFSTVVFGDDILCFGGTIPTQNAETGEWTNTHTTNSYKINITNKTCEAFSTAANSYVAQDSVALAYQDLVYFVGGRSSSGSRSSYVYRYRFTTEIIDHTGWTQLTRTGSGSGEGSSVEANPADVPTETLSTVKINGTTYSLPSGGTGEGGSSVEIINIQGLNSIPEEYRDREKLTICWLKDGGAIYHVSYRDSDDYLYFECIDELEYRYITISTDYTISRDNRGSIITDGELANHIKANSTTTPTAVLNNITVNGTTYSLPEAPVVEIEDLTSL